MDIGGAVAALNAGQKVARDTWYAPSTPAGSIFVLSVIGYLFYRGRNEVVTVWGPCGEDVMANDWEIIP